MNCYQNTLHNSGIKLRLSKILLLVLVITSIVTLACWRLLRPVDARINVTQSGSAPNYVVTVDNEATSSTSGTTVTFTGSGSSGVLTLGEQDGVLTYGSYAKGNEANFKNLSAAQRSVTGPSLTQITRVIVNGGPGDDTLIINNSAGSLLAANAVIEFNGGYGSNTLIVQGDADAHLTYTPGSTPYAGVIETSNGRQRQLIEFTGLQPVQDNVSVATSTVNGTDGENAISYSQYPGDDRSTGNTIPDTINLNNQTRRAGRNGIVIAGVTVNLNGATGPVAVLIGDNTPNSPNPNTVVTGYGAPVTLVDVDTANLDATNNTVTATGTTQNDNIIYTPTGAKAGTFYDNIASGNNLVPNTVFNIANVAGNFMVFNDPAGNADHVTLRGTAARDLFEINQGSGVAQVLANNVTGLLPVVLGMSAEILDVQGVGGENTFQVIPAPGLSGQAQDNMLINLDGGPSGANNALVVGSTFGATPGTLPANLFAVVNKGPIADTGAVRVFTSAVANPDINYTNVQVVTPIVSGGNVNPNLLVIGPDLNEPNEQPGTATFLGSGSTIQVQHAAIFPVNNELPGAPADNDFYRVVAQTTGTLNVQLFFRTLSPALLPAGGNLSLQVLDAAGTVLGTGTPQVTIPVTAGQNYFLHVSGATPAVVNGYDVSIINTVSLLTVTGLPFNAVEGLPFSNQIVGTFNGAAIAASNFTATINWGDGTASSTAVIVANGPGAFNVLGGHTYSEEGNYNVVVQVTDSTTSITKQANSSATVADAPLSIVSQSAGSSTTFSGTGGNNTSVTPGTANVAMSAFQAAIGGVNNGGTASPQNGGFRTINWDGVLLTPTDGIFTNEVIVPNHVVGIPTNRFQTRGVSFEEIYAVANDGFTSVNPGAAGQFPAFSPTQTFAMFNDNTIDFSFVLPSAANSPPISAVSRGFGAIFLDVEAANTTSIEYFSGTTSLGKFFVPVGASGQAEFFGVLFQNPVVTDVEITLGNAKLFSFDGTNVASGPADAPPGTDLAVTDDFVYPEPLAVSTGITINATAGTPFTAKVASFTDADPNGQVSDYSVVIDWGDGTSSSGGVTPNAAHPDDGTPAEQTAAITPNLSGGFDVNGTHTYTKTGVFNLTVSIRDTGGASIGASATAVVSGVSQSGSMQFNAATSSVLENAGTATLTVTRTGDTSQASSVHFETGDGTALQKSDYTFNSGTVQFAPGDTSKTFTISLVNDDLVEGSQTFFVTLSNPSFNYVVGSPNSIAVTIVDDDTVAPTTNPIDDANFFVREHYLDFLGREPDASGLAFWSGQITSCGADAACIAAARVNVSAAFFFSIEYQETSGDVIRTQRVAFGRQSSDASSRVSYLQFMEDTRQVGAGVIVGQPGFDTLLEQNKQAYATQIVNSAAFLLRFPIMPAANYVDALAASAGVTLTTAERTAAINAFGAGGTSGRVAALRSIADSNTVRQAEFAPSFVLAEFFGYLRRNPTDPPDNNDAGYQFWLAKLNSFNGDFTKAEMVKAFIAAGEYRQRFGP